MALEVPSTPLTTQKVFGAGFHKVLARSPDGLLLRASRKPLCAATFFGIAGVVTLFRWPGHPLVIMVLFGLPGMLVAGY